MASQQPILASTNLSPALFVALAANGSKQQGRAVAYPGLPTLNTKRKHSTAEQAGQRKNHAHLPSTANGSSLSPNQTAQAAPADPGSPAVSPTSTTTTTRKKPGRKPINTEPANKRTAQNRAAQRAFRERKERYVKELETRVAQLEEAHGKAGTGELVQENISLKEKISELENENRALKEYAFTFQFPPADNPQDIPALNLQPDQTVQTPATYNISDFRLPTTSLPISPASLVHSDATPFTAQSSPSFTNNDIHTLDHESFPLFDEIHSSTLSVASDRDLGTPHDNDLDSILAGIPLGQFSFVSTEQLPTSTVSQQPFFNSSFNASSFQTYRDPTPFSATFSNPLMTENNLVTDVDFDEFLSMTAASSSPQAQLLVQPQTQQPTMQFQNQTEQRSLISPETLRKTKDVVEDPGCIDELCDIFKTKAQCSEMVQLQNKILEACEKGKKDEVMDLLLVCKEKKRMHMLRQKAGVTVLPPGLDVPPL